MALAIGCGGSSQPLPACEQGSASLVARTVDGKATIGSVKLHAQMGQCYVLADCTPAVGGDAGAPTLCSDVRIGGAPSGTSCEVTFTSSDGSTFVATATVRAVAGSGYQCTSNGQTETAYSTAFDPPSIDVDFSMQGVGDAATAD